LVKRIGVVVAAVIGVIAVPGTASAATDGTTCSYTSTQQLAVPIPGTGIVAYADADGGSGMSGQANAAAGVCVYSPTTLPTGAFAGGTGEVGEGTSTGGLPGAYAVIDGSNANTDPQGASDGYAGVSNYETGTTGNCSGGGTGTNSGGCFEIKPTGVALPVPLLVCGNTSGDTWSNTVRDGCAVP
jgi:hypothetical protein